MLDESMSWKLVRFPEMIDSWVKRESPDDRLRLAVLVWSLGRRDDPYVGMQRDPMIPNLWFGPIEGTERDGTVVTCSYWIFERARVVRCDIISTLNRPT